VRPSVFDQCSKNVPTCKILLMKLTVNTAVNTQVHELEFENKIEHNHGFRKKKLNNFS
jgi:hypothetical protein